MNRHIKHDAQKTEIGKKPLTWKAGKEATEQDRTKTSSNLKAKQFDPTR